MSDPAGDRGKTGYIGQPLPRVEDRRLITGAGRYTDDISATGQAWAAFVRSPYPHAEIAGIDTAAAAAMPGVLAVLTGADYVADGHVGVRHRPRRRGPQRGEEGAGRGMLVHMFAKMQICIYCIHIDLHSGGGATRGP